ncbi:cell division protein FtsA [Spiroplasma taiwanense]|uniref:Cell division protein FtsA n=1 Tax=Spiroplasma taiwanense CT-1 TaxID=1276220 RepID=S5MCM7_9MOLU|nr:cell division protein FtsA [Spiroplasma taiwanense]AGR41473.1 cell division protein FtsA [Spiroplasma taiwanense CT-1]
MQTEIYAVLQVTKKDIRFVVGKYKINTGLKVIFKEKISGNWLTNEDEIIDPNQISHRLSKIIHKFNTTFQQKIERISIVYPTLTMQIKDAIATEFINSADFVIKEENIKTLYSTARKIIYDDKHVVINIKPYLFTLDNVTQMGTVPLNHRAKNIVMKAKVYTISKKVKESFNQILKSLKLEELISTNELYALARQSNSDQTFRQNFAIINWDWEKTDIGYFSKETLAKKDTINFGIKNIIQNVAERMQAKFDIAEKYLFKILDFSSNTLDDTVVYRKYISSKGFNYELRSKDLKNIILEEINSIIDKSDILIKREFERIKNFQIHHTGKVTTIAGFEKILFRSQFKDVCQIYFSLVTGASEIWTTAICGMIKCAHIANKNNKEIKTSTFSISKSELIRDIENNQLRNKIVNNNQRIVSNFQNNRNIPQQNGIINTQRNR